MRNPKPVEIIAKFPGTCPQCQTTISVGDAVVFYRHLVAGKRTWHRGCARAESLSRRIYAAWLEANRDCMSEQIWTPKIKQWEAELATLKAEIEARRAA